MNLKKSIAIFSILSLFISGCATYSNQSNAASDKEQPRKPASAKTNFQCELQKIRGATDVRYSHYLLEIIDGGKAQLSAGSKDGKDVAKYIGTATSNSDSDVTSASFRSTDGKVKMLAFVWSSQGGIGKIVADSGNAVAVDCHVRFDQ